MHCHPYFVRGVLDASGASPRRPLLKTRIEDARLFAQIVQRTVLLSSVSRRSTGTTLDSNAYESRSVMLLLLVLHLREGSLKLSGYLTAQLQGDH